MDVYACSHCSGTCVGIYVCGWTCTCACECMFGSQKFTHTFLNLPLPFILRKGLLLDPEPRDLTNPASQIVQGSPVSIYRLLELQVVCCAQLHLHGC